MATKTITAAMFETTEKTVRRLAKRLNLPVKVATIRVGDAEIGWSAVVEFGKECDSGICYGKRKEDAVAAAFSSVHPRARAALRRYAAKVCAAL